MVRLGLQLTLRSGREALGRALMIAVAVAIGVTVLLSVFADYHAYQAVTSRQCWECTQGAPGQGPAASSELWNYSENIYEGRFVEVLDVAPLGADAPVVPGLARLPGAGQFYASPALASLTKVRPGRRTGRPFPGHRRGDDRRTSSVGAERTGGDRGVPEGHVGRACRAPSRSTILPPLLMSKGRQPSTARRSGSRAIVVLFPLLILVNTATRLAAARREERFAAMRLVGGTGPPGQCRGRSGVGGERRFRHPPRHRGLPGRSALHWPRYRSRAPGSSTRRSHRRRQVTSACSLVSPSSQPCRHCGPCAG